MPHEPDVQLHDDPPPEWPDADLETDLSYAAAAGGFTDDESMAGDGDLTRTPEDIELGITEFTEGTDPEVIARTKAWLAKRPGVVN